MGIKIKFINVKVVKDMTSIIHTDVPEHELLLLQAANGSDMDEDAGDDGDYIGSVTKYADTKYIHEIESFADEYARLKEKFGQNESGDFIVTKVYGAVGAFRKTVEALAIKDTKAKPEADK